MDNKSKHVDSSSARSKVWVSLVSTTLAVVVNLIAALISSAGLGLFQLPKAIVAVLGTVLTVLVIVIFTYLLTRRERSPSRVAQLKDELTNAYLIALDNSAFNPLHGGSL